MFRFAPLALLFMLACGGDYHQNYFERVSGIKLPSGLSNIQHYTESDIAFTSHYTVPVDSAFIFASQFGFQNEPPVDWFSILFIEELSEPWNDIPEDGIILYCTGSNNRNRWDILMHPESGSMWVTVYYTDAGGDPPF